MKLEFDVAFVQLAAKKGRRCKVFQPRIQSAAVAGFNGFQGFFVQEWCEFIMKVWLLVHFRIEPMWR
jgi:hypothetical protein